MSTESLVLVGGGLASATAAETLRDEGFDGHVIILAAEGHLPYLRPPLSKDYLAGKAERDSIFVHPAEWYNERDIEVETNARAVALDAATHRLTLADNRVVTFDRLLLAAGASPRMVDAPGSSARGIHHLRTVDDSESLKAELSKGGRAVVSIGAGWIGLEVAAVAREYGNSVTVIGRESVPLQGPLGDELGSMFRDLHESHGVVFDLPAQVRSFTASAGAVTGVVTDSGMLPADLVIVGVGAIPNVDLAESAGLALGNGLLVDEHLRSSAPDIFGAGDLANVYHPVIRQHVRNEHWANAIGTGKIAARSMLGRDAVFDEIPYFYTDQYDLGMEYSGYPPLAAGATVVYRGNRASREFVAFWLVDGKVVAGMNVNRWGVNGAVQQLIRSGRSVDPARLADETVALTAV